jgi:hypothetical protein
MPGNGSMPASPGRWCTRFSPSRAAGRQPSCCWRQERAWWLVGSPEGSTLDLSTLQSIGVRLAGRLQAIDGGRATFASNVNAVIADTDRRMHRASTVPTTPSSGCH